MQNEVSSLVFLQYLSTVFDNIEDAIILINVEPDQKYRLMMANKSFFKNTGYKHSVVGSFLNDFISKESYKDLNGKYQTVIETRQPVTFTTPYSVPLGRVTYRIKVIPILNSVGVVIQLAGIIQDVTELELLRKQIKELAGANAA